MGTDDDLFRKRDPFEAAMAALEKAKEVRRAAGQVVDDEPVSLRRKTPEEVLEEARRVREMAGRSPVARAREEAAHAELERLKSTGGFGPEPSPGDGDPTEKPSPPEPKKRTL